MNESKLLEALALVGLHAGDEFNVIGGGDTTYYIDETFGILSKNDGTIHNEILKDILHKPFIIGKQLQITEKEKEVLTALYILGYRWVARDIDKNFYIYSSKPYKSDIEWKSNGSWIRAARFPCFDPQIDFQHIKWEDEKPFDIKAFLEGE